MRSRQSILFILLSLAFVLSGCFPEPKPIYLNTEEPATTATEEPTEAPGATATSRPQAPVGIGNPVKGGTVTVGISQEPVTLNPLITSATIDDVVSSFIVEGLVGIDLDGRYVPVLAEKLPVISEDGLQLTYKLKQGILFSDGSPFTCADVQFTLSAVMSEFANTSTSGYSDIERIDCPDEYTAEIYFTRVYAPYLRLFAFIVPQSAGDLAELNNWEYNRAPIGTGPWVVRRWQAGDYIVLAPNPNYRESGKPYLNSILLRILPSRETGLELLATGEVTTLWDLTEADFQAIENMDGVAWEGALYGSGENELLVLNLGLNDGSAPADSAAAPHPILSDVLVRQAIQYAIDKQLLADALLFGNVNVGTTVLPTGPFACPQPPSEYSPELANALLEEAGWVVGNDGIRSKGNTRLQLTISTTEGNQLREQTEQVLVEMLKEVGIELVIENLPSDALFANWEDDGMRKKGRYDILLYTTGAGLDPDSHLFSNYHSARIPTADNEGAGNNFSRYINADVDEWIDAAALSADQKTRKDLYCKIAEQINTDLPRIFLYERMVLNGYHTNLQNFSVSPGVADFTYGSENWWLAND